MSALVWAYLIGFGMLGLTGVVVLVEVVRDSRRPTLPFSCGEACEIPACGAARDGFAHAHLTLV